MYDVLRPGIVEESPKRVGPDSYRGWGGRTWNARLTGMGRDSPMTPRQAAKYFFASQRVHFKKTRLCFQFQPTLSNRVCGVLHLHFGLKPTSCRLSITTDLSPLSMHTSFKLFFIEFGINTRLAVDTRAIGSEHILTTDLNPLLVTSTKKGVP